MGTQSDICAQDAPPDPGTAQALTDGCHLIVEALKLNGVNTIYGVVGIPITDVARVAQASGIRYIGLRHESAGHPQRTGRAGERNDELLSNGPNIGLQ